MIQSDHAVFLLTLNRTLATVADMLRMPGSVKRFARVFSDNKHELFVVGGAVRDALRGQAVDDYDFATSATPEEVMRIFHRVIPTGVQHGTVTVLFEKKTFEVTTYRVDGDYSDQRRPDSVTFTRSLEEDLARRDLTINAIALDPQTGRIIDPFDGRGDLKRQIIRTVGSPFERFGEDALRMVRAIRFAATLNFDVLPDVLDAITANASRLTHVAQERIGAELEKLIVCRKPSPGWRLFRQTRLLPYFLPELEEDADAPVPVFEHLLLTCDCAPSNSPVLRWSALLHDIGKPRSADEDEKGLHFHGHDEISALMAEDILTRLRFSNERIRAVTHLVRNHMFGYSPEWSDAAVRRFIARVGSESVFLLTALRRADACGKTGRVSVLPDIDELEGRLRSVRDSAPPLSRERLAVNGNDLIRHLGISPGPRVGVLLEELLRTVIDDPSQNKRDTLLEIAESFFRKHLNPEVHPRDGKTG